MTGRGFLVGGVIGVDRLTAGVPGVALLALEFADRIVLRLGTVLDRHVIASEQVVVPARMGRIPALACDDAVLALVLDSHKRNLADLAALVTHGGHHDDRDARVHQVLASVPPDAS